MGQRSGCSNKGIVLANSWHEPFGLVGGLETMAVGGNACTGISAEEYAVPGRNALVLQTSDPREFLGLFRRLRTNPAEAKSIRREARAAARRYAWGEMFERLFLLQLDLLRAIRRVPSTAPATVQSPA